MSHTRCLFHTSLALHDFLSTEIVFLQELNSLQGEGRNPTEPARVSGGAVAIEAEAPGRPKNGVSKNHCASSPVPRKKKPDQELPRGSAPGASGRAADVGRRGGCGGRGVTSPAAEFSGASETSRDCFGAAAERSNGCCGCSGAGCVGSIGRGNDCSGFPPDDCAGTSGSGVRNRRGAGEVINILGKGGSGVGQGKGVWGVEDPKGCCRKGGTGGVLGSCEGGCGPGGDLKRARVRLFLGEREERKRRWVAAARNFDQQ